MNLIDNGSRTKTKKVQKVKSFSRTKSQKFTLIHLGVEPLCTNIKFFGYFILLIQFSKYFVKQISQIGAYFKSFHDIMS